MGLNALFSSLVMADGNFVTSINGGEGDAVEVHDRVRAETRRFTAEGPVLELPPLKTKEEGLNVSGEMPLRVPAGRAEIS